MGENGEIAGKLAVSEGAVRAHGSNIPGKLRSAH
jgi:DNA-binding NarL/FixJ family response regulator